MRRTPLLLLSLVVVSTRCDANISIRPRQNTSAFDSVRPDCAKNFGDCSRSTCCDEPRSFGCFLSNNFESVYLCLPFGNQQVNGTCVDSKQWLCPDSWLVPSAPPSPPMPAEPPASPPFHSTCYARPANNFQSCWDSRCCRSRDSFGCFRRPVLQYAECLPYSHQNINGTCVDRWGSALLTCCLHPHAPTTLRSYPYSGPR